MKHWRKGIAVVLVMATAIMLGSCGGGLTPIGPETAQELSEEEFQLYERVDGKKQAYTQPEGMDDSEWRETRRIYFNGNSLETYRGIKHLDSLEAFCKAYAGCEVRIGRGEGYGEQEYAIVDEKLYEELIKEEKTYRIDLHNVTIDGEFYPLYKYKSMEHVWDEEFWNEVKKDAGNAEIKIEFFYFTFSSKVGLMDVIYGEEIY